MRHPTWDKFCDDLDKLAGKYGGSIYDYSAGKSWDIGQAICREVYGPNWNKESKFIDDNNLSDDFPVPARAILALDKWLKGEIPEWAQEPNA